MRRQTPYQEKAIAACIWCAIFIAGIAWVWQMTEPDDATNGISRAKQEIVNELLK